jgi:hypothetical protein
VWLVTIFFVIAVLLAAAVGTHRPWQRQASLALCAGLFVCSMLVALVPFRPQWSARKLEVTILDVGYHGSKNSTMPDFLAAVRPRRAIISAGEENPYGHPSPDLIARLESAGVRILGTDRDGAAHVLTDGDRVEITCFVACPEPATSAALRQTQAPNQKQKSEQQ